MSDNEHPTKGSATDREGKEPLAYSLVEAARILGVSTRTLRRVAASGKVPAVRIGSRVLIARADLGTMGHLFRPRRPAVVDPNGV